MIHSAGRKLIQRRSCLPNESVTGPQVEARATQATGPHHKESNRAAPVHAELDGGLNAKARMQRYAWLINDPAVSMEFVLEFVSIQCEMQFSTKRGAEFH